MAYPFRSWSSLKKLALPGSILAIGAPLTVLAFSPSAPWSATADQPANIHRNTAPAPGDAAQPLQSSSAEANPTISTTPQSASVVVNGQSLPLPDNSSYSTDIPHNGGSTHVEAQRQTNVTGSTSTVNVDSHTVTGDASSSGVSSIDITVDDQ